MKSTTIFIDRGGRLRIPTKPMPNNLNMAELISVIQSSVPLQLDCMTWALQEICKTHPGENVVYETFYEVAPFEFDVIDVTEVGDFAPTFQASVLTLENKKFIHVERSSHGEARKFINGQPEGIDKHLPIKDEKVEMFIGNLGEPDHTDLIEKQKEEIAELKATVNYLTNLLNPEV